MFGVPKRRRTAANLGSWVGAIVVLLAVALSVHGQENKQAAKLDDPRKAAALAAWDRIVTVLQHPRCMNCHQENVPLQGDERRIHIPLVVRGRMPEKGPCDDRGLGVDGMHCTNCHNGSGNNETSGVPGGGNGVWSLAPERMKWQGLSSKEICDKLTNPESTRDPLTCKFRTGADLIDHMEREPLVRWAWTPGGDRTPVPMPREEFVKQMEIWVAGDMACPTN
jgi:hypothetical protein